MCFPSPFVCCSPRSSCRRSPSRAPSSSWCRRASPWTTRSPRCRSTWSRATCSLTAATVSAAHAAGAPSRRSREERPLTGGVCARLRASHADLVPHPATPPPARPPAEWYPNTTRRGEELKPKGIHFMGMGVSGGEEGARLGPSLMPGGPREAYEFVKPILEKVAAQVRGRERRQQSRGGRQQHSRGAAQGSAAQGVDRAQMPLTYADGPWETRHRATCLTHLPPCCLLISPVCCPADRQRRVRDVGGRAGQRQLRQDDPQRHRVRRHAGAYTITMRAGAHTRLQTLSPD
jgi:hypothetical protein